MNSLLVCFFFPTHLCLAESVKTFIGLQPRAEIITEKRRNTHLITICSTSKIGQPLHFFSSLTFNRVSPSKRQLYTQKGNQIEDHISQILALLYLLLHFNELAEFQTLKCQDIGFPVNKRQWQHGITQSVSQSVSHSFCLKRNTSGQRDTELFFTSISFICSDSGMITSSGLLSRTGLRQKEDSANCLNGTVFSLSLLLHIFVFVSFFFPKMYPFNFNSLPTQFYTV